MKGLLRSIVIYILFLTGVAPAQNEPAVKLEAGYIGDLVNNYSGGIQNGTQYLGMANLKISFNTWDAGLWTGGSFFLNAANTHGGTPTNSMIGDFQGVSNIEAGNLSYIHELWYSHEFNTVSITAGLQDLAVEFAVSEFGAFYLNGSFGIHSTLSDNIPAPVFPLTALGVLFNVQLNDKMSIKTAAFDGLPDDFDSNPYNLKWDINSRDGILSISEFNYSTAIDGLTGTYKFGTYYHNHVTTGFEAENPEYSDNYGAYFVGDQVLYQNLNGKQMAVFGQIALSPANKNENNYYLGAGVNYKGMLFNRTEDIAGLAIAHAGFRSRKNETVIELSYRAQINDKISVQPDVQYIINPAGRDINLDNTLTGTVRIGLNF